MCIRRPFKRANEPQAAAVVPICRCVPDDADNDLCKGFDGSGLRPVTSRKRSSLPPNIDWFHLPRLFIADGAKALSKAIRRTFGSAAAIQRCQIHKARNIMERLPKKHHEATRRALRQAWELDHADNAEKLIL